MTTSTVPTRVPATSGAPTRSCDRAVGITKSLLGYGVLAGPVWEAVLWAQALTRDGFDPSRHPASLLANGSLGWIQVVNFLVAGVFVLAGAVGVGRALAGGRGSRWAPRLIGVYGVGLLGAAVFRADPADGFPIGTPAGTPATVSWHGGLHYVFASIGFFALIAACFVLARRFAGRGQRSWAVYSGITGGVFLAANLSGVALGAAHPVVFTIFLTAAVALVWSWLTALSVHLYRGAGR